MPIKALVAKYAYILLVRLGVAVETVRRVLRRQMWNGVFGRLPFMGFELSGASFSSPPWELDDVQVGFGTYAPEIDTLHVGRHTRIRIGKCVSIGRGLRFITGGSHNPGLVTTSSLLGVIADHGSMNRTVNLGGIEIGSDVWIGVDVTIMGGVKVGDGVVIGTKALFDKDVGRAIRKMTEIKRKHAV